MVNIEGSTVLVTGGQRGLGKEIVATLLERGAAKVYATARTPVEDPDPRVEVLPLDVTDPDSVLALARAAADVSIVVNNAGIAGGGPLLDGDFDTARAIFDTNVFGTLRIVRAFAPILAGHGGGALVNILSVFSWASGGGAYGASKAAFWSMTNSLRLEMADAGTQVVGVHVSFMDTDMTAQIPTAKLDPHQVAAATVTGLQNGDIEILVDEDSRRFKAAVAGPVDGLNITGSPVSASD
jgi:NAD(P)-dependent dehydrogenase (short-subunit alcohol dehydrogenase family)